MRILVIYDGSKDSKAALKYGMQKMYEVGGELIAFHVPPRRRPHYEDERVNSEQTTQDPACGLKTIKTGKNRRGDIITTRLAAGRREHEILQFAEAVETELIVSPPEFESLMQKACCLADIVS